MAGTPRRRDAGHENFTMKPCRVTLSFVVPVKDVAAFPLPERVMTFLIAGLQALEVTEVDIAPGTTCEVGPVTPEPVAPVKARPKAKNLKKVAKKPPPKKVKKR